MNGRFERSFLLLLLVALMGATLAVPPTRYGDASEYVMATWSLLHDRDLVYEERDLLRGIALRPEGTDIPAGLQLVRTSDGVYRFGGHTIYYPILAAPFVLLLGHRGFYVLNALLFWLVLLALRRKHQRPAELALSAAALIPSAAFCYLFWTTPENAILCFLALALFHGDRHRPLVAGAALGVASAMKFPLALFGLPLAFIVSRRGGWRGIIWLSLGFLLLFLPQLVYNLGALRCLHATFLTPESSSSFMYFRRSLPFCDDFSMSRGVRVMHRWTDLSHFGPGRLLAALLDPSMGLLWFYPMVPFLLLSARWGRREVSLVAILLVCLAVFCSVQRLFTHQVGLRALNYVYPVMLFLPRSLTVQSRLRGVLVAWGMLWGSTFAVFPLGNSRDSLEVKPIPAYRLWASARERVDQRFFFERHRVTPRFAASGLYPDGWTVGGETSKLVCDVVGDGRELTIAVGGGGRPERRFAWRAGGAWADQVLAEGGPALLRVPIPPGEDLLRVDLRAEGFCPVGRPARSLGVRVLRVAEGTTVLYESVTPADVSG